MAIIVSYVDRIIHAEINSGIHPTPLRLEVPEGRIMITVGQECFRPPPTLMEQLSHADVLRTIENYLGSLGVSFASLVIDALRNPESTLARDLILRISDVLEALRPNLDDGPITELGWFLASIVSSELSELGEDDLWHLPATSLSATRLQEFSVKKMSQWIFAMAPGFPSFLHSICVGKKVLGEVAVDDDKNGVRLDARQNIDPAQLLEIVRPLIYCIHLAYVENRRRRPSPTSSLMHTTGNVTHFRWLSVYSSI